jgi:hypothetical protein
MLRTSEVLGGFGIVQADGLDEAIALAKSWPTGGVYEIWPILES